MFRTAKIKLTAWYLLIIMTVTLGFSSIVYVGVNTATQRALEAQNRRIQRQFVEFYRGLPPAPAPVIDPTTILDLRQRILNILIFVNLAVLGISGSLGYFLAGKTLQPIEDMLEKQKRFISDAAHELKTPLTAMRTDLEVTLRDKELTLEKSKRGMESAVEEIDKLHKFTNRLLTQSKFQSGNSILNIEEFRADELIGSVIDKLEPLATQKNIKIIRNLPAVSVFSDKNYIKELVTNLIENSIKYNKNNSETKVILSSDNSNMYIDISDKGIGIDKNDLPHIFEPFYRSDRSRTHQDEEGFGLGLAIVKEIVNKLHGNITVHSELNEGTVFNVKIPHSGSSQQI